MNVNIKQFITKEINNQNTYLVIKNNKGIIIDASTSAIVEAVKYAKDNNIIVEDMIITHGHWDHLCGIDYLISNFKNVTLYINQWDEDCLFNAKCNLSAKYNKNIIVKNKINKLVSLKTDTKLNIIGLDIEVVHIPGHTPGSQYILIKEYNSVFIGDTIFIDKIGFHGEKMDYCDDKYFKRSLQELTKLDKNLDVYPGHHKVFILNDALKNNKVLMDYLK